jgi:flavodoxin
MTKIYVLYASATGNAEHIAKDLASGVVGAICGPLDDFKKSGLLSADEKIGMLVVCSTTGKSVCCGTWCA